MNEDINPFGLIEALKILRNDFKYIEDEAEESCGISQKRTIKLQDDGINVFKEIDKQNKDISRDMYTILYLRKISFKPYTEMEFVIQGAKMQMYFQMYQDNKHG